MRIGKVAKQVGITVEAIRFYEKKGLIEPPTRNESGYRDYPEYVVQLVSFIKRAKELGFSLKEIKNLMSLRYTPGTTCSEIKSQTIEKIANIDRKVKDLLKIKGALAELVSGCPGQGPLNHCTIMEALESKEMK
ncbi:MAG: MerR family transcriptional regulator [Candidatus Scalindua sp.]|jgi:MerR family mercuric resistance operon transcriptional regulator|nr:MerR family transcriptional regulator [Candidatus Scalindua sp.]